ncbi:membrane protein [Peribacillus kribbensis]|uniref:membrane protein n=1 Tax=Peribacillus kribbensis TaxID=356658 RepID=UPI0003F57157|nr:membrane protein [Peribacillus kribbensis]
MSLLLLLGILGFILVIVLKKPLIISFEENNRWVNKLKRAKWFQNHWLSGLFLFSMNAALFAAVCLFFILLSFFVIPYLHILVGFAAVILSFILWIAITKAWKGTRWNRFKMGITGSSFYILLIAGFAYWMRELKPSYPGEDIFMGAIFLIFGMIAALIAFIACLVITGFSHKQSEL